MKFNDIQPGQTVYMTQTYTMGNTSMKSVGVYPVYVKSVDAENEKVLASWNGNEVRSYYKRDFSKWKKDRPKLIALGHGQHRLAKRGE